MPSRLLDSDKATLDKPATLHSLCDLQEMNRVVASVAIQALKFQS